MPIDPQIALQYKAPQFADPMQRMGNFLALQNAGNQNALAQYSLAKAQREDADQNALRSALQGVNINTPEGLKAAQNALLGVGNVKGAIDINKAQTDREHVMAQTAELRSKVDQKNLEQFAVIASSGDLGGALNWLKQASPNVAAPIDSLYQQMRANGEPAPSAIQKLVFGLNPNVREAAVATAPKAQLVTNNQSSQFQNINPLAGQIGAPLSDPMAMQMTPSEVANLPLAERRTAATESQARTSAGQLGVAQGNLAVNRGRLGVEQDRLKQDRIGPPIEVTIDGKNTLVRQDKKTGRVLDANNNDVTEKIAPKVVGSPLDPGRISMALQASQDLNAFEDIVFPKDANGKRTYAKSVVMAMSIPGTSGIGTAGREAYSAIENAVAAKLRGETGAATNPGEIENTAARFRPTLMDTAASAKNKVDRLREFMGMTLDQLKESNHISQATYDKAKKSSNSGGASGGWSIKPIP